MESAHTVKVESLKTQHKSELTTLENKYNKKLDEEKSRLGKDITRFKEESEKILKENQNLLLKGFETDKGSLVKSFEDQLESLRIEKNKINEILNSKILELKELKQKFYELTEKEQQSEKTNRNLQNDIKDLENRLYQSTKEIDRYNKLLTEAQVRLLLSLL